MKETVSLPFLAVFLLANGILAVALLHNNRCPHAWTVPANDSCTCGSSLNDKVVCHENKGVYAIVNCFCMTTGEQDEATGEPEALVGPCLFTCTVFNHTYNTLTNQTLEGINDGTCRPYNRHGRLCGKCQPNHGLPVYSFSLSCVNCTYYKYNWLKYIAVAYIPLTAFYFFIITFRVSATSGWLNGYVLLTQMTTIRSMATLLSNNNVITHEKHHLADKYLLTIMSIWNLDFLRSAYSPFCLHPSLSALQVLVLDYVVAIYPLLLITLTYLLVKLYDQYQLVSWLCMPFYRCFHSFKREWDINSSLIKAFATFYLLSYVKVLNVTADVLAPIKFQNIRGNLTGSFFYHDASIPYFGSEHKPYAVAVIAFAFVYNMLPFLLFCVYPCGWFHRVLNKTRCRCYTLHTFMDAMLGAYSHKPRERRYFGAGFLLVRVGHIFAITLLNPFTYFCVASYIMIFTIVSVVIFQPYKNKWHNRVDIILFSAVLHAYLMIVFSQESFSADPFPLRNVRRSLYEYTTYFVLGIIPLYGVPVLIRHVLPQRFIRQRMASLYSKISRMLKPKDETEPYRWEHGESDPLLIPV